MSNEQNQTQTQTQTQTQNQKEEYYESYYITSTDSFFIGISLDSMKAIETYKEQAALTFLWEFEQLQKFYDNPRENLEGESAKLLVDRAQNYLTSSLLNISDYDLKKQLEQKEEINYGRGIAVRTEVFKKYENQTFRDFIDEILDRVGTEDEQREVLEDFFSEELKEESEKKALSSF